MPEINTFEDALQFVSFARMMRDDLPDGQWESLKETLSEYAESHGRKPSEWSNDAKEAFTVEVLENMLWWL